MSGYYMRRGGTFVEVLMACVVLAIIVVAGASFIAQVQGTLKVQRSRCVALAMVNSRLEEVRNTPFGQLTNLVSGPSMVWIKRNGAGGWQVTTAADHDNFILDAAQEEIRTGLILTNWPVLGLAKVLRVTVQGTYKKPDYVAMTTLYAH